MIQRMLAIWSLVPLPFINPAWTSGCSQFMYCWSLTWRILSITLLVCAAAVAKSLQSCPTLCNPIDGSPPGSTAPGILQARTLEWVAISFSNAWKWSRSVVSNSSRTHGLQPTRLLHPWDFPGKSTGVGCHCLLHTSYVPLDKLVSSLYASVFVSVKEHLLCRVLQRIKWGNTCKSLRIVQGQQEMLYRY